MQNFEPIDRQWDRILRTKPVRKMGCLFGILFLCSGVMSCGILYMLFRLGWAAIEWLGRN